MSKRYQGGVLGVGFNPLQAPNAPTIGAATAGNTTVSVAFTAPANVGGSAISTYAVRVSPGNVSATGSSSPISVTGLTNDTTYTFSVAALNSYGPSPYSGTVTATPSQLFVEDVFSTWLYTGTGSTQTITNGINLSGQGGLVWFKCRTSGIFSHQLYDTVRGATIQIGTNSTSGNSTNATGLTAFTSSGFTIGSLSGVNSGNMASWTFREAPKFFDVVTYTGNGVAGRQIAHNLGVTPGMVIVKRTDSAADWVVWQRTLSDPSKYLVLNTTAATATDAFGPWGPTGDGYTTNASSFTDTFFRVANDTRSNASGATYVAYLFAHDTTSDGIIQCGSFTTDGSGNATTTLGWEPQWVLIKPASGSTPTGDWKILDNMRGYSQTATYSLFPNASSAESLQWDAAFPAYPTATGMYISGTNASTTFIYIAIRRGPMRTPTVGTTVFSPNAISSGQPAGTKVTTNFPVDVVINTPRSGDNKEVLTRLTASNTSASSIGLQTNTTDAETNRSPSRGYGWDSNTSLTLGGAYTDFGGNNNIQWNFRRAPSFFDVVCYTGTGSATTFNHNLGVAPELMLVKQRNSANDWPVYGAALPNANTNRLILNGTQAATVNSNLLWNSTSPTSTVFSVGTSTAVNGSGSTYVAYLFASAPGVSKVGSYTGTGTTQTINCGFTTGARFVLIKRTDSTGDWYVWDSARGIVAGNDPYLLLNSTAAEVTSTDYIDTDNSGFQISSTAPAAINANGGTFIYLAIS